MARSQGQTEPQLPEPGTNPGPIDRTPKDPSEMSFGDHLEDLRRRLILAILGLVPVFVLGLAIGRPTLSMLIEPVQRALLDAGLPAVLMATSPLETFSSYVRIAVVITLLVGSPWALYQLWRFVAPGLYANERRFVHVLVPLSSALTVAGIVFLYAIILPVVLSFFIQFGSTLGGRVIPTAPVPQDVELGELAILDRDPPDPVPGQWWVNRSSMQLRVAIGEAGVAGSDSVRVVGAELTGGAGIIQQYRISEYVKLFLSLALAFALGFQMPVVVLLLGWAGLVTPEDLRRHRKYAAMGCAMGSAILTPADPFSMVLLAIPLFLLYELGGVLLRLLPASKLAGDGASWPVDLPNDEER